MTIIDINSKNNKIFMIKFLDPKTIELKKTKNELDEFVFNFLDSLEIFTDYVIISGYISILLGRPRSTDDVDILVPRMKKEKFKELHDDLIKKGFWFINSSNITDLFEILDEEDSIRIAVDSEISPNIELKFIKDEKDKETFKKKIKVNYENKQINISPIELQIAYKEQILQAPKDMEDALHLRLLFKDNIKEDKIIYYKQKWT